MTESPPSRPTNALAIVSIAVAGCVAVAGALTVAALALVVALVPSLMAHGLPSSLAIVPATSAPSGAAGGSAGGSAPGSATQQSVTTSCTTVANALDTVDQTDFAAALNDPGADPQAAKTVVSGASAALDGALPSVTSTQISGLVSGVMEGLDAETTALNRYLADPSIGTDDLSENAYQTQAALNLLADACGAEVGSDPSAPQTKAQACAVLDEQTTRADFVNTVKRADGNPAKIIAAINTYANDLEVGISQITNTDIIAVATAADVDVRAEAKALKAYEVDPSGGNQAVVDAATNVEASA
ncbi:hypothetical protein [Subtercola sp. YIM 133946]|uniref:hypothetical protein n=1 Tax=Subtercola sp. YIM 133946 TaxID=3118909 RepID=UPI002F95F789